MNSATSSPNSHWFRRSLRVLLLAVLVGLAVAAWCIYEAISTAIHAEMALHATHEACLLVTEYVEQHDGAWPLSWHDVEQIDWQPAKHNYNVFPWPKDSERLQQFVTIDFAAEPDQLAKQTVADFEAIQPIGPHFPIGDGWRAKVLESLQATRNKTHAVDAASP